MPNETPPETYNEEVFPKGALYFDLIFPVPPSSQALTQVLGRAAQMFGAVEADEEIERLQPRIPIMKPTDRRLLLGQVMGTSLIEASPELKTFLQLMLALIDRTGARVGTVGCWGDPGFFGAASKDRNDLASLALMGWVGADEYDLNFGTTGPKATSEQKLAEVPDKYKKIVEAKLEGQLGAAPVGPYHLLDLLGKLGGYGQEEYKDWLKRCFVAFKIAAAPPPPPKAAEPPPEAPKMPIRATELDGKPVLIVPKERFGVSMFEGIAKGRLEVLHKIDQVPSRVQEEVARKRVPFLAELPSLTELFSEGRPLDKTTAAKLLEPVSDGYSTFIAQMPRFGRVRVIGRDESWWFFSDAEAEAKGLLGLLR
jgi:hypothetical protein